MAFGLSDPIPSPAQDAPAPPPATQPPPTDSLPDSTTLPEAATSPAAAGILQRARAAAGAQRHDEAAGLFAEAAAASPARRTAILREWADQVTYAGRPADAVPLYREALGRPDLPTDDRPRAERGLAFALLWASRFGEAESAFEPLAQAAPGDADLRKGYEDAVIGGARAIANRGDNPGAARAFRRAAERVPGRRAEFLREWADQTAYAEDPAGAVPLYREALTLKSLPPEERIRARRGLAFALLWSGQPADALPAFARALEDAPRDKDLRKGLSDALLESARQAEGRGDKPAAIRYFDRLFAYDPPRRQDLLIEYAEQVLYDGQPRRARPLFREALARPGISQDDWRRATLALARSFAWAGDHAEAVPVYDRLIESQPDNADALVNRGETLNALARWRPALSDFLAARALRPDSQQAARGAAESEMALGRPRAALTHLQPFVAAGRAEPATFAAVAAARRNMGRPDLAEDAARAALAADPNEIRAPGVLAALMTERRPLSRAEIQHYVQSDDLRVTTAILGHEMVFDRGLTVLQPQVRRQRYRGGTFPEVDVTALGLTGRHRFDDAFELAGYAFLQIEEVPDDTDFEPVYDVTLSWQPTDEWKLGLRVARLDLAEPEAIANDIVADEGGLIVTWQPSSDFHADVRAYAASYSDGNARFWGQADAEYRVMEGPDLWLGGRATAFDFTERLDNGYWNPDAYASVEATAHLYGPLYGDKLFYDLQAAGGFEHSDPDGDRPIWSASARLTAALSETASLSLYAAHFANSSLGSGDSDGGDDGFWRTTIGAEFRLRW